MTQPMEHDWPPTKKYHRKARRIETVEILPPRQPERHIHVNVNIVASVTARHRLG